MCFSSSKVPFFDILIVPLWVSIMFDWLIVNVEAIPEAKSLGGSVIRNPISQKQDIGCSRKKLPTDIPSPNFPIVSASSNYPLIQQGAISARILVPSDSYTPQESKYNTFCVDLG